MPPRTACEPHCPNGTVLTGEILCVYQTFKVTGECLDEGINVTQIPTFQMDIRLSGDFDFSNGSTGILAWCDENLERLAEAAALSLGINPRRVHLECLTPDFHHVEPHFQRRLQAALGSADDMALVSSRSNVVILAFYVVLSDFTDAVDGSDLVYSFQERLLNGTSALPSLAEALTQVFPDEEKDQSSMFDVEAVAPGTIVDNFGWPVREWVRDLPTSTTTTPATEVWSPVVDASLLARNITMNLTMNMTTTTTLPGTCVESPPVPGGLNHNHCRNLPPRTACAPNCPNGTSFSGVILCVFETFKVTGECLRDGTNTTHLRRTTTTTTATAAFSPTTVVTPRRPQSGALADLLVGGVLLVACVTLLQLRARGSRQRRIS